jgi:CelD/BcsL family acetyltransferase involved in cellulose biosynthesis
MLLIRDHANWGVDLSSGLQQYLDTVSWKLKKDLRAKRKHVLKDFGAISLKEISGEEPVRKYFDIYAGFARNAFAERKRKNSVEDDNYASFLKDLMVAMEKTGRLAAYALLAGDRTVAVNFGYRSDKGFDWVLTSFDYELKYFRPGYILMEEQLKHIYGKGGTYCNMYGHDRFFKEQWANDQKPLYKLFLIRRTLRGGCYSVIRRAENALRSNPAMVRLARRLKRA